MDRDRSSNTTAMDPLLGKVGRQVKPTDQNGLRLRAVALSGSRGTEGWTDPILPWLVRPDVLRCAPERDDLSLGEEPTPQTAWPLPVLPLRPDRQRERHLPRVR